VIGQTVSHYRITRQLGAGGMGVVYEAVDTKLDRLVALKFLPPESTRDPDAKARFIHEAKAASALDHPNICTIHEIDETEDDQLFIAMACYVGETLKERIARGPLPLDEAIDIAQQVTRGLAQAHGQGIVHRDIKPANIFRTTDGLVKVVDFGLAKLAGQTRLTKTGSTMGTVAYMSPQQARGETVDARSDLFSVGVVLYELVTGHLPFQGDHEAAVLYAIAHEAPAPLAHHRPDVAPDVERLVMKAIAKDPDTRYQSAEELIADLERIQKGEKITAAPRLRPAIPLRILLAAGLGAVAIAGGFWLYTQFVRPDTERAAPALAVSANVIAVFPFTVRGGKDVTYLGEGMVDLLGMKLDGVPELRSVDTGVILGLVRQNALGSDLTPVQYRAIAERTGAGLYVVGSILETGGQLNIRASLFETSGESETAVEVSVEGIEDEFLDLVDSMAADLVVGRYGVDVPMVRLARQTTPSYPALKAFLQGESHYRAGQYARSVEACERAVAEDSTFALAYYRMDRAAMSSPVAALPPGAREKVMRYRDQLPENMRRILDAYDAWLRGDAEEGLRLLRANLSQRPDDLESRCMLGEILFHYGRVQGLWLDEVRAHFEKILFYDPDHLDAACYLHWLAGIQERYQDSAGWVRRRLELEPEGDYAPMLRAERAFTETDPVRHEQVLAELEQYDDLSLYLSLCSVAGFHGQLAGAAKIARVMTAPSRAPSTRAEGHVLAAGLAVTRGRWHEAEADLAAAEAHNINRAVNDRAILSITPPVQLPRSQLQVSRQKIARLDDKEFWPRASRPYLTGLLSARLGDHAAAMRCVSELDSLRASERAREGENSGRYSDWLENMIHCVRAEVAWLRGEPAEALAEIEKTDPASYWTNINGNLILVGTYQRYLRGALLQEAGRLEEALRWYGSLGQASAEGFVYLAAKHLKLGEVHASLGDGEQAAEHYGRFLDVWRDCDPEQQQLVDEVRTRLARLGPRESP